MNITEMVTTTYAATCQICDTRGPRARRKEWAEKNALEAGWQVPSYFNGLRHVSTTVCPRCAEEPRYAQWLEDREVTE